MASYMPSSAGGEPFIKSIPLQSWELDRFEKGGPVTLQVLRTNPEVARLKRNPADRLPSTLFQFGVLAFFGYVNWLVVSHLRRSQFLLKAGKLVPGRLITHESKINEDGDHILTHRYGFLAPDGQTVEGSDYTILKTRQQPIGIRRPEGEHTLRGQPLPEPGTPVRVFVASHHGRPGTNANAFSYELL
jgi:hypothetical protein